MVEEVFSDFAPVIRIHLRGRTIRTTVEHPFFTRERRWMPAGALEPGELFRSRDGQWIEVERIEDLGEETDVYNLRIADFHTYFAGSLEWSWMHGHIIDTAQTMFRTSRLQEQFSRT